MDRLGKVISDKKASRQQGIEKKDSIVFVLDDVTLPPMLSIGVRLENLDKIISNKASLETVKQCLLKGKAIDI